MKKRTSIITAIILSMFIILAFFIATVLVLWINQNISTEQSLFSFAQNITMLEIFAIFFSAIFITSIVIRFVTSNIGENFEKFNDYFKDAASSGKLIDENNLQYKEFTTLAQSVNIMIDRDNKAKKSLEFNEKYLQTVLDAQKNIVLVRSNEGLEKVNHAFLKFFKVASLEEFKNSNLSISDYFVASDEFLQKEVASVSWVDFILKNPLKTHKAKIKILDKEIIFEVNANIMEVDGKFIKVVTFNDIDKLEKQNKELEQSATIDALTKIANRMKFNTILEQQVEMSKRYNNNFSLILLDIDNFKMINDNHGHSVGDDVLVEIALVLKNSIRKSDLVSRWGGEEFAIVLPQSRTKTAVKIAEKLRLKIENNNFKEDLAITCSFGVCEYKKSYDIKEFIECVDKKLYAAKHSGKNQVQF